mmetsp:Transcript_49323/g.130733  ORF Transcript_49323/g.130733 Transcript_49323/m.130733 type:complete len:292 (+) Transcript_49323:889-1764(+)
MSLVGRKSLLVSSASGPQRTRNWLRTFASEPLARRNASIRARNLSSRSAGTPISQAENEVNRRRQHQINRNVRPKRPVARGFSAKTRDRKQMSECSTNAVRSRSFSRASADSLTCTSQNVARTSRCTTARTRSCTLSSTIARTFSISMARMVSSCRCTRSSTKACTRMACSSMRLSTSPWKAWICLSILTFASAISVSIRRRNASLAKLRTCVSKIVSSVVSRVMSDTLWIHKRVRILSWTLFNSSLSTARCMAHSSSTEPAALSAKISVRGNCAATNAKHGAPNWHKEVR